MFYALTLLAQSPKIVSETGSRPVPKRRTHLLGATWKMSNQAFPKLFLMLLAGSKEIENWGLISFGAQIMRFKKKTSQQVNGVCLPRNTTGLKCERFTASTSNSQHQTIHFWCKPESPNNHQTYFLQWSKTKISIMRKPNKKTQKVHFCHQHIFRLLVHLSPNPSQSQVLGVWKALRLQAEAMMFLIFLTCATWAKSRSEFCFGLKGTTKVCAWKAVQVVPSVELNLGILGRSEPRPADVLRTKKERRQTACWDSDEDPSPPTTNNINIPRSKNHHTKKAFFFTRKLSGKIRQRHPGLIRKYRHPSAGTALIDLENKTTCLNFWNFENFRTFWDAFKPMRQDVNKTYDQPAFNMLPSHALATGCRSEGS